MHLHTRVLLCVPVFHYQLREKVKEMLMYTLNNVQRIVLVLPHAVCRLFPQNDSGHLLSQTSPETHGPPLSASYLQTACTLRSHGMNPTIAMQDLAHIKSQTKFKLKFPLTWIYI